MSEQRPFSFQRVERAVELPKRSGISEAVARKVLTDAREKAQEQRGYVPTTEEVRNFYGDCASQIASSEWCCEKCREKFPPTLPEEFKDWREAAKGVDRWLAAHDAKVREQVARDFLDIIDRPTTWSEETRLPKLMRLVDAVRSHAARLAEQGPGTDQRDLRL